ncbi:AraC family transcriptional regulator [Verrucomicrobia bacterium S94]|nr:AraC family transcriptional regulator [Verrucomicrobia bacterium S94]
MPDIPKEYIENLLAPLLAAQIFMGVLIYVLIVRKRISADYKLLVCFLLTFTIFLAGRAVQEFSDAVTGQKILLFRMALLFSVGVPSLQVAAARQSGFVSHWKWVVPAYAAGALVAAVYVVYMDAAMSGFVFTEEMLSASPVPATIRTGRGILLYGALITLVLPSGFLMVRELSGGRNRTLSGFLSGALIFGIFMMVGVSGDHRVAFYYTGSVIPACCWAWSVFQDIRDMKGRAALLKEELQYLVLSGKKADVPRIAELLRTLEALSEGNLDRYKIRVREILSMLTDVTITAGGDPEGLIERHREQERAIEESGNPENIRAIAETEAAELSAMIADIPEQRANMLVHRAKAYIGDHFCEGVSVLMVAEQLGVSRAHLMREFKKATEQTVNQYITTLRMERAKELLRDRSVTDTAFEVGYNNSNYFSTVFKKSEGLSPLEFKKLQESGS